MVLAAVGEVEVGEVEVGNDQTLQLVQAAAGERPLRLTFRPPERSV